ncbi:GFA family protein [Phaeobacter sp. C3_T13_0]|uniref:GFA family protein n=1 Tax=Phaeobacter cretensis TaxID=3342641 RepID=UPI0039BC314A
MIKGHCLCGEVQFETKVTPRGVSMCHCGQCRRQSGGIWSSAYVADSDLTITGEVRWYASSPDARRGFCPACGSFLFWKANTEDTISFALGAVNNPTGLQLEKHIFVANKGDYYHIADGLPQEEY